MKILRRHIIWTLTFCITALLFICSVGITVHAKAVRIDITNPPESITGGPGPFDGVTTPTVYSIQLEAAEEQGIVAATSNDYTVSSATPGTSITLNASAKAGYRFKGWQVINGNISISDKNTFTMPEGNVHIQAVFEVDMNTAGAHTITIEQSSQGEVIAQLRDTGIPVTSANAGAPIQLFVIPKEGYRFKEWKAMVSREKPKDDETPEVDDPDEPSETDDSSETGDSTEQVEQIEEAFIIEGNVFQMPEGNVKITAVYEPLVTGQLTMSTMKKGSMSALVNNTSSSSAKEGTQVTLLPKPNSTYRLKSLTVTSNNIDIPVNDFTFIMPAGNVTISATFEEDPHIIYTANGQDTALDTKPIQKALDMQNNNDSLTVYVPAGTYYIDKQLRIGSNTTLQLADGAVIKRSDAGLKHNMIMTSRITIKADGSSSYNAKAVGKYDLAKNIVIEGGTWDGGNISKSTAARNLFNIGHSNNVIIRNTTIQNCYGSHLIEFSGSKNCQVYNCTFTGFRKGNGVNAESIDSEAIQMDVCYSDWNTAYLADKTACQNITITNNRFVDYPSAVGNHHQLSGAHNKNIVISHNTISNKKGTAAPGIYLYGFDKSSVTHNTITGHSVGIKTNNSFNYSVLYNNIADCKTYGIHSTGSSSGEIKNNTITNTKMNGIYANANTKISSLYKNKLTKVGKNSGHSGIWITGSGTTVNSLSTNTISGAKEYGINVTSGAKVTNITKNTISDIKKSGIIIKNAANKVKVKNNTLKNIKGTYAINIDSTVNNSKHTYSAKIKTTPIKRKKGSITVTGKNMKKASIKIGSKTYSSNFSNDKATIQHKKIAKKQSSVTLTVKDKYKNSIVKTLSPK